MTLLVSWKAGFKDLRVLRFATRADAERAGDAMEFDEKERSGAVVDGEADLVRDVPTGALLAIINTDRTEPVKKLESRAVGARRAMIDLEELARGLEVQAPVVALDLAPPDQAVQAAPTGVEGEAVGAGSPPVQPEKEADMAKAKRKETAAPRRVKGELGLRHKRAKEMIERAKGASLDELCEEFKCSRGSASNVVNELRSLLGKLIPLTKISDDRRAYKL